MTVAAGWLALGVVLHLANQVARGRGWHAVVRRTGAAPRGRDTVSAWVAGAGAGGVVSARGGDAVRVLLLGRRLEGGGALLTGTLVAESAGELAVSVVLLSLALALGVGPTLGASTALYLAAAVPPLAAGVLIARRVPRARAVFTRIGQGCACLRCPGFYAREVLSWQLVSRVLRLFALACFLTAFRLPATPLTVLLVVFAQGSGRLVPFAPASVGAGAAILAATFGPITGDAVSASRVASFFVGTSTVLTVVGTMIALTICLRAVRWSELSQASANAGRTMAVGLLGLWTRTRAAIAPRP